MNCPFNKNEETGEYEQSHIWQWAGDSKDIPPDYRCLCGGKKYSEKDSHPTTSKEAATEREE